MSAGNWTPAGLTLTLGSDANLHVYQTGTTTDAVAPCPPASMTNIEITSPSSTGYNLVVDSTNGDPIPAGGLNYCGAGGLIKTGSGRAILFSTNTNTAGTIVSAGTLLINTANALAYGNLTIRPGGVFIYDPSVTASSSMALATSSDRIATTAVPSSTSPASSSLVLLASKAADVSALPASPGRRELLVVGSTVRLRPRRVSSRPRRCRPNIPAVVAAAVPRGDSTLPSAQGPRRRAAIRPADAILADLPRLGIFDQFYSREDEPRSNLSYQAKPSCGPGGIGTLGNRRRTPSPQPRPPSQRARGASRPHPRPTLPRPLPTMLPTVPDGAWRRVL